jgi:hypothetical protein
MEESRPSPVAQRNCLYLLLHFLVGGVCWATLIIRLSNGGLSVSQNIFQTGLPVVNLQPRRLFVNRIE